MHRVYQGHKHCPDCGAELDLAAAGKPANLPCPRCTTTLLSSRLLGDIVIDECGNCNGLFLDRVAIKRVIEDRQQARAEALLGTLPAQMTSALVKPGQKMYLKCPVCATVMNRKLFAMGAGVIVDVCKNHGTFFDTGELPAIIQFVMKGGLEKAEKKKIDDERQRLRAERAAASAGSSALMRDMTYTRRSDEGGALVDLLFSLF
jgi:Zn-finger nucleic acid-binding protein